MPETTDAFAEALYDNLAAVLGPVAALEITVPDPRPVAPGNDPYPPLVALEGDDFVDTIFDAYATALGVLGFDELVLAKLEVSYRESMLEAHETDKANKQQALENAAAAVIAAEPRSGTMIGILSPAPVETDMGDAWAFGPVVPISVQIAPASPAWSDEQGGRIQILCNGNPLRFPAGAWTWDARRKQLELNGLLRLDQSMVQAGMNVLEVSVANSKIETVRATAAFLVDAAGPIPGSDIEIDEIASTFNPKGNDHKKVDDEIVALRWMGSDPIELQGWTVMDAARHTYRFDKLTLQPGGIVRLHSGGSPDDDDDTDRYWGRRAAVWNNDGDTVMVLDDRRLLRAQLIYDNAKES